MSLTVSNHLSVTEDGYTLKLTLNRPDKRNALNRVLIDDLYKAFDYATRSHHIRVVLLTGSGSVFSAGADLAALQALQSASYEDNLSDSQSLARLFDQMYRCSKPIIGAVNGHAIAGGCGLVTLCDVVVAADNAKFGYTETRIGFVPALVARFALSKIGETQSRRLLLSGMLIDAPEAARVGLVTETVPQHDFPTAVQKWCALFSSEVSPQAVSATKELLRTVGSLSWNEALSHATSVNATARGTSDCQKGIAAFLNKEPLRW